MSWKQQQTKIETMHYHIATDNATKESSPALEVQRSGDCYSSLRGEKKHLGDPLTSRDPTHACLPAQQDRPESPQDKTDPLCNHWFLSLPLSHWFGPRIDEMQRPVLWCQLPKRDPANSTSGPHNRKKKEGTENTICESLLQNYKKRITD